MPCSSRTLGLRIIASPRWSSTAGSALRPVVPARATVAATAPERRTSSSGLAPMNAASRGPEAEAEARREQLPQRAELARRVDRGRGLDGQLSRQDHLVDLACAYPLDRRRPRSARSAPAGVGPMIDVAALGMRVRRGQGSRTQRGESSSGAASSRSVLASPAITRRRSGSFVPRCVAIATSGRIASAGGSDDQIGSLPPSGSKASPVDQTGPAPAGSPARLLGHAVVHDARAARLRGRRTGPGPGSPPPRRCRARRARTRGRAAPSRTSGRSPAAIRPRSRSGPRARRARPSPEAERPSSARDSALSNRESSGPASRATLTRAPSCRASSGRSRPRPCGPSRSGRAGGSSARRPRSCRRCPSPRWSASDGRRRRSWRGRSRRTA